MTFRIPAPQILIDGQWRDADAGQTLPVEDPSSGETFAHIAAGTARDVDAAVAAARAALAGEWGAMPAFERGRVLARIGHAVLEQIDDLAHLEARDVGKPLKQARADVVALARYLEFYAGAADKIHGETIPFQAGYTVYTLREPHGVTGHIIPWNYPMQIIGRSVTAALVMGNAAVLKPAEQASLTSMAFARIATEAGLPAGALNVVTGLGAVVGAALAGHRDVNHVSFTGSTGVGVEIQKAAADNAVPVTLELGGKSPQIVFDDADLDKALPFLVNAGIQNAGQTCSAGSRILIQRGVHDRLLAKLVERYQTLTAGPALADHDLGPLISAKQKAMVSAYLELGRQEGLIVAEGRVSPDAPADGHYVPPTLFANVTPDHRLAQEEIFGPAVVVIPFDTEDEAVAIANGTAFGLVAGVWTADGGRQMRMAKRLHAGQVFLNNYGAAGGVELPFGGVGKSGHGREKGFEALYGFSTLKTVAAHHG
ncbi:aldehyde dehydrogenase family protein [uncultured Brevundimonas sp.]|uniref:aldehyde dehydrogenase family protein n=1 Tax=uncultured Brevundimonas sp. TaxID=213418 RepID=UPI0030EEC3E7|tara:strand:- start:166141 stop:167589 length:1449 start_codon:yes stop_codon:yes gene_type:complete